MKSWSHDRSPWPAPAVFGNEGFGDGAAQTLLFLQDEVLSNLPKNSASAISRVYIVGYSLAGLVALWAGYQTDCFDGIAAASPSIWFPGFLEYMRNNRIRTEAVYLSLGDREEKTKNPLMSQVGNAIRDAETILKKEGKECILEWNKGNHFMQPDLRTAKALAWLMNR